MFDQQHLASSPAAGILFLSFLRVWRAHLCCSLSESFIWKLREHHLLSEGTPSAHLSFSITMLFVFCCSLALLISLSFLLRRFSSWLPFLFLPPTFHTLGSLYSRAEALAPLSWREVTCSTVNFLQRREMVDKKANILVCLVEAFCSHVHWQTDSFSCKVLFS